MCGGEEGWGKRVSQWVGLVGVVVGQGQASEARGRRGWGEEAGPTTASSTATRLLHSRSANQAKGNASVPGVWAVALSSSSPGQEPFALLLSFFFVLVCVAWPASSQPPATRRRAHLESSTASRQ